MKKRYQVPVHIREFFEKYQKRYKWSDYLEETIQFERPEFIKQFTDSTRRELEAFERIINDTLDCSHSCIVGCLYNEERAKRYDSDESRYYCSECDKFSRSLLSAYLNKQMNRFNFDLDSLVTHFQDKHKRMLRDQRKTREVPLP